MRGKDFFDIKNINTYGRLVFPFLFALIISVLFARAIWYEMYLNMDDNFYVIFNKHLVLSWSNIIYWFENSCIGLYTPLPMISYMLDNALWGYNAVGYHLQSILWHILTVIIVYNIFIELEIDCRIACLLTLVFAVHPQRIESVVWIAERKDVMSGFFYFSCLLSWLKSYKQGRLFSPLSCFLMILGCLSKPMAVTIPVVILCLLWHKEHRLALKKNMLRLVPYLIISLMYISLKLIYLDHVIKDFSAPEKNWQRTLLMVLNNFRMYFMKTFMPNDLIPLYPYFEQSASGIVMIFLFYAVVFAVVLILLFKAKEFLIYDVIPMLLCFTAILLPVIGFFNFSNSDFADRYSYIPSVFLLYGTALVIERLFKGTAAFWQNRRYYWIAGGGIAFLYMLYIISYTAFYMPCWKDNYTLYLTICDHENPNFRGMAVLANLEYSRKNYPAALACADALKPRPWMNDAQKKAIELFKDYIRGMVYYDTGMKEEAMTCFSRILLSKHIQMLKAMVEESCREIIAIAGNYYIQYGKLKLAAGLYAMMPIIYPDEAVDCCFYRGLAAFLEGNLEAAKAEFMAAQKINPDDVRVVANLKHVEDMLQKKAKSIGRQGL